MRSILSSPRMLLAFLLLVALAAWSPALIAQTTASNSAQETVLYSFGGADGAGPLTGVIADAKGAFYGTTVFGGVAGVGTVFELKPGKSGYTEKVLYSFRGGSDGDKPFGGLVVDKDGALYGTTIGGGINSCFAGCGTVFKLTPGKSGYTFSVLYDFQGGTDAQQPVGGPVIDANGAIYGATQFGGTSNAGAVFKLTPGPSGYSESVLHSFSFDAGGYLPQAGLTIDRNGSVYGTTYYGGDSACSGGCGVVFKITPTNAGYSESVIYSFGGHGDGSNPFGLLTVHGSTSDVYGTTEYGGAQDLGTVFKLSPSDAGYTESVLHSFTGKRDGFLPMGKLLLKPNGVLYGTVALGGGGCSGIGCGTVFKLKPTPSGYSFRVIYRFRDPINGADPEFSSLIMDASGALYGTTRSGGSKTNCSDGGPGGVRGCGVVFKIVH